jgi:RNA polymerase sigma-70 factor (ECF subfamily)
VTFEQRASLRTWLYRIATNLGCDLIEQRERRSLPQYAVRAAQLDDAAPAPSTDPIWIDPLPDTLLVDRAGEPETQYLQRESVTLAFLVMLQTLPPRQRAILLLRDVLEFRAREVADLLNLSTAAVESARCSARERRWRSSTTRGSESVATGRWMPQHARFVQVHFRLGGGEHPGIVALLNRRARCDAAHPWWFSWSRGHRRAFAALLADSTPGTQPGGGRSEHATRLSYTPGRRRFAAIRRSRSRC